MHPHASAVVLVIEGGGGDVTITVGDEGGGGDNAAATMAADRAGLRNHHRSNAVTVVQNARHAVAVLPHPQRCRCENRSRARSGSHWADTSKEVKVQAFIGSPDTRCQNADLYLCFRF